MAEPFLRTYTIQLNDLQLGQILDGLRVREESWRKTAIYLRAGFIHDDSFACEECNDEAVADWIAGFYHQIIEGLERQRAEQDCIRVGTDPN